MTRPIRIVAPFRPFPPEASHHRELADFDWIGAIEMMAESAARACRCPVHILTDVDTTLPVPSLQYVTERRRLMLWYLEVSACYLESDDFDRDTVSVDCDQLIYQDLSVWFHQQMDLGILVRTRFPKGSKMRLPIFNGVQFWAVRAKDRLAAFYRRALAAAEAMSEELIIWGADTVALADLLAPLDYGIYQRGDLAVDLINSQRVLSALSHAQMELLEAGRFRVGHVMTPVLDFRNRRKIYMRAAYDATIVAEAVA